MRVLHTALMLAAAASVQAFAAPGASLALRTGRPQNAAVRASRFASSLAMALPSGWQQVRNLTPSPTRAAAGYARVPDDRGSVGIRTHWSSRDVMGPNSIAPPP